MRGSCAICFPGDVLKMDASHKAVANFLMALHFDGLVPDTDTMSEIMETIEIFHKWQVDNGLDAEFVSELESYVDVDEAVDILLFAHRIHNQVYTYIIPCRFFGCPMPVFSDSDCCPELFACLFGKGVSIFAVRS